MTIGRYLATLFEVLETIYSIYKLFRWAVVLSNERG
jgi:hypothetical protein